ncbi:hypothetical protein S2M10_14580 [Sphingomonas sp. S2M10]|uniref:hypothetical protein n=1 Tax=Sphingomonas sp. S2M10 TaxID=2705010 RepID=UPI001457541A|nr:hypothetical protein [Sphingomonas sp. S2M10]NLS26475.1 hypothetical protein [Sphingomonas sp. S2M10]
MTMPSDINPAIGQHIARSVHVATYEHPYGTDIRVFLDQDQALIWRTRIAREWWSHAFDQEPPPDDEIGEEYFERMLERDEFFSTMECDIEPDHADPADLMTAHGGIWGEYPDHPVASWIADVANGDTRSGYWCWVVGRLPGIGAADPTPPYDL